MRYRDVRQRLNCGEMPWMLSQENDQPASQASVFDAPTASVQKTPVEASPVPQDFTPTEADLAYLLNMNQIPYDFSMAQVAGFILYWQEMGEKRKTWHTAFRYHVQLHWRKEKSYEQTSQVQSTVRERLTDTGWARGYGARSGSAGGERALPNRAFIGKPSGS